MTWVFAAAFGAISCGQPADPGPVNESQSVAAASEPSPADYEPRFAVLPPDDPGASGQEVLELVGAPTKRTRTIAAMMFQIGTAPPDPTRIGDLLTGPGSSLRHMYNEISFGIQDISVNLLGPYTLPVANCLTIACCGPSSDRTGNGATVQGFISALPMTYDHYFWVYGNIPQGANCGTWGDEGTATQPAVYSSYSFQSIVGMAQELGHNFGMTHEPTLSCTGGATFLDDSTQCTHREYGSQLSFMGGGARHPSAYHKLQEGWIGKCNAVRAGGSGTFTLVPQELPCDGVQLLQVRAPKTRPAPAAGDRQGQGPMLTNYYLEMRGPYGFDSQLRPMVTVSIGADFPTAAQRGSPYLYLLDLAPGTTTLNDAGLLTVGQSFSDPGGGLTFTLDAIDATSATVTITSSAAATASTCVDQTMFTAPGPDATSCGPLVGIGDAGAPPVVVGGNDAGRDAAPARDAGRNTGAGRDAAPEATPGTGGAPVERDAASGATGGSGGAGTSGGGGAAGQPIADAARPPETGGGTGSAGTVSTGGGGTDSGGVQGGCSCSMLAASSSDRRVLTTWVGALALCFTRLRRSKKRKG